MFDAVAVNLDIGSLMSDTVKIQLVKLSAPGSELNQYGVTDPWEAGTM